MNLLALALRYAVETDWFPVALFIERSARVFPNPSRSVSESPTMSTYDTTAQDSTVVSSDPDMTGLRLILVS